MDRELAELFRAAMYAVAGQKPPPLDPEEEARFVAEQKRRDEQPEV